MTTPPDAVRSGLLTVTAASAADIRAVATAAGESPTSVRNALFVAAPLLVGSYGNAAATLAAEWYEELRDAATPSRPYTPRLVVPVREDAISSAVAVSTQPLYDLEREMADAAKVIEADFQQALAESLAAVEAEIQKEIAASFRETVTENTASDPDAAGWKRHAQTGACKFCLMLAAKGAVFTKETARFAAHTTCSCIAGPEFGGKGTWAEATPMQYLASQRKRSEKDKAALRAYLNKNYPDAPG